MKTVPMILLALAMTSMCQAADIKLAWDAPPQAWVTNLYVSEISGGYDFMAPVASADPTENQVMVKNLLPGKTYFFVAKHFDPVTMLNSDPSNEVSFTVPIPPEKTMIELEIPAVRKYKITLEVEE